MSILLTWDQELLVDFRILTKTFNEYLSNKCKNSFFLEPVTEIKNLNSQKSPGYDGISIRIIKIVDTEISESLSHIFNSTFLNGTVLIHCK